MNNKKVVSVICIILIALLVVSLLYPVLSVSAYAEGSYDEQLAELKREQSELANQRANAQNKLDSLNKEKALAVEQKVLLEERDDIISSEIELIEQEITVYNGLIEEKAKEVDSAMSKETAQLDKYRSRIRSMEENGNYNILALLLNSASFSSLLASLDDMGEVMDSDKNLFEDYQAAREETENVKAEYEEYKAEIEDKQSELETQKTELEEQIKESEAIIEELEEKIAEAEEEQKAAEAAMSVAAQNVLNMMAKIDAERQAALYAQQEANQVVYEGNGDTGSVQEGNENIGGEQQAPASSYTDPSAGSPTGSGILGWPVPSSHRISSTYKNRWGRMHTGIDIDGFNQEGSPVVAADNGYVYYTGYDSGYGNYVIIDHNNGMRTLYAHMSGIAVSTGQSVSKGQTVGYLGSTGSATGTHLHFEVMLGGADGYSRTDPLPYLSGYELEPGADTPS